MKNFSLNQIPVVNDALGRKSNRRLRLIEILIEIGGIKNDPQFVNEIISIFDKIHAGACIIDDMVDNEIYRSGTRTFYARHGKANASISALHLIISSCKELDELNMPMGVVLSRLEDMILSEEADIGVLKIQDNYSPLDWYKNISSMKTAHELLLLFDVIVENSKAGKLDQVSSYYKILSHLGHILQLTNDWRDVFVYDPLYRTGITDKYKITFNLPMAIYCEYIENEYISLVGSELSRKNATQHFERIKSKEVKRLCKKYIDNEHLKLTLLSELADKSLHQKLVNISSSAISGIFWENGGKDVA